MRHTSLSRGAARLVVRTGDAGTEVTDGAGQAVAQHGTDRHDEVVERLSREGWHIADQAEIRPPEAAATPPPAESDADATAEPDLGPSS